MDRLKLREYKRNLSLSSYQKALLVGTVLGDGYLRIVPAHTNAQLQISHGEEEKRYVFWKYMIFKDWCIKTPWMQNRTYYKDRSRKLKSWLCYTISHPVFTRYHRLFYSNGKKVIPRDINNLLESPISLAVWYMDDGTKLKNKGAYFSTQNFNLEDQERLISCLRENFGLKSKLHQQRQVDGEYYRLYIAKDEFGKLKSLIEPYILPYFQYKLLDNGKPRRDF